MSGVSDLARRRLAWAVPLVVAGAVAAGVTLAAGSASGASPNLPKRTAAQLLVAVQRSSTTALSGVVNEKANLGLPSLPGDNSGASLSWQTFITGSHSAKVWIDGQDKQRAALLGELSEADVVHNGKNLWTYTSDSNTVSHTVLPAARSHDASSANTPDARDLSPSALASKLLKAVSPTTAVSVDTSRMVAGRPAYTLVVRPRDARSTVQKVTIAVDAKTFVPLQVQVFGSGSTPALQTGFTSISFKKPAASTFDFITPAGATTSTNPFGSDRHHQGQRAHHARSTGRQSYSPLNDSTPNAKPKVIGSGWTSVLEIPSGQAGSLGGNTVRDLTTAGSNGQRVLHTALVNAVLMPDGRVFVGAVDQTLLEHVAATN